VTPALGTGEVPAASPAAHRRSSATARACVVGERNYLIEGLSGTGKTSVAEELERRGFHVVHGDRALAYRGDPETGEPTESYGHEYHIWNVEKVKTLAADPTHPVTFFCGGSRNFSKFIHLFDEVFVLEVDIETLNRRLDARPDEEWGGGVAVERARIVQWHEMKADVPANATAFDATAPLDRVVDEILRRTGDLE
jgi:shikimate kinase